MKIFSERLRALKAQKGLTALQMSAVTGVPQKSIEKYLLKSGSTSPSADAIVSISSALNVTSDWLLGLTDEQAQTLADDDATEIAARSVIEQFIVFINQTHEHYKDFKDVGLFMDGKVFGADPSKLASDYAYQVLKLRSEITAGRVSPDVRIGHPTDNERSVVLVPQSIQKTDKS